MAATVHIFVTFANVPHLCYGRSMAKSDPKEILRRRLDGKTQSALARELGIKRSYLSDILRGKRDAGPQVLRALGLTKVVTYRDAELPR
jgi:Helix-turn-helix